MEISPWHAHVRSHAFSQPGLNRALLAQEQKALVQEVKQDEVLHTCQGHTPPSTPGLKCTADFVALDMLGLGKAVLSQQVLPPWGPSRGPAPCGHPSKSLQWCRWLRNSQVKGASIPLHLGDLGDRDEKGMWKGLPGVAHGDQAGGRTWG